MNEEGRVFALCITIAYTVSLDWVVLVMTNIIFIQSDLQ